MLNKVLTLLAALVCLVLLYAGVNFIVDPAAAAAELGMPLLDGLGRSTQIGDLTAFFVVAGGFGLAGLITKKAVLLYTPAALVGAAALFRTLASLLHDAPLAPQIGMELVMLIILVVAARRMQTAGAL